MELALNRELTPDECRFLTLADQMLEKDRWCEFDKVIAGRA
jgi:hypothetical protein